MMNSSRKDHSPWSKQWGLLQIRQTNQQQGDQLRIRGHQQQTKPNSLHGMLAGKADQEAIDYASSAVDLFASLPQSHDLTHPSYHERQLSPPLLAKPLPPPSVATGAPRSGIVLPKKQEKLQPKFGLAGSEGTSKRSHVTSKINKPGSLQVVSFGESSAPPSATAVSLPQLDIIKQEASCHNNSWWQRGVARNNPPPRSRTTWKQFPWKLHDLLEAADNEGFSDVVSWLPGSNAFRVHLPEVFEADIMPRFFQQSKFKSFRRQLNMWSYQRISFGEGRGGYQHRFFVRGLPALTLNMERRKQSKGDIPNFNNGLMLLREDRSRDLRGTSSPPGAEPLSPSPSTASRRRRYPPWYEEHEEALFGFASELLAAGDGTFHGARKREQQSKKRTFTDEDIIYELVRTFAQRQGNEEESK